MCILNGASNATSAANINNSNHITLNPEFNYDNQNKYSYSRSYVRMLIILRKIMIIIVATIKKMYVITKVAITAPTFLI